MKAKVGDRLTVHSHRVGQPARHGVVKEVRGDGGEPPWVVEWSDRDGEHLYFPSSDAEVTSRRS